MRLIQIVEYLKKTVQLRASLTPFLLFLSFCFFIAIAPSFKLIPWAMRYDEKRMIQAVLVTLPVCWLLLSTSGARDLLRQLLYLPQSVRRGLTLICTLGLLSSLLAPSFQHAILEFSLFMLLAGLSLTTAVLVKRYQRLVISTLLIAITFSAFAYEVTFFTSYVGIFIQGDHLTLPEPFSGFSSIRFFNQYQIWTLPLMLLPILNYPRLMISIRWLVIILAVGWWVLLFASQSRGAQLAIAIAFFITLIVFRKDAWKLVKANLLTAMTGWLLYLFLFFVIPGLEHSSRLAHLAEDPARLQLWKQALQMTAENPWLGVGPMHYAYYPNIIAAHPHNALLQIASEWGLPVTIILIALTFRSILAWSRRYFRDAHIIKIQNDQQIWIGLFCSLLAGLAYAFVSGVIVMPLSQTLFAVIAGLMLGLYHRPSSTYVVTTPHILLLRLVAGASVAGLLWSLVPETILRIESDNLVPPISVVTLGPRFWQIGGIPH